MISVHFDLCKFVQIAMWTWTEKSEFQLGMGWLMERGIILYKRNCFVLGIILPVLHSYQYWFYTAIYLFTYLVWESERQNMRRHSRGGTEREGGRESQAALDLTNHEIMTLVVIKSQTLKWLSHPVSLCFTKPLMIMH